ncbi:MBG domain-containing protein [Furfurilactobacillus cerevisiae]|uniref:MBG domain-containing protein n=1 Tax=Furfurilactobacillus rossiae TaxID=231049 RepID=UPI003B97D271
MNGKVSATNGTGTLGAKDSQVIITNQDATADEEPSQVTIRRTSNDAITVSEIGLQDKMVNDLTVTNTQTAADATVVMGKNVEPSFSSTTIVTPVSALHQGVVLTADPSFGTNGIKSTYEKKNADGSVTNTPDDTNGLTYHGYVTDASSTDNTKDYGTAENSTTTIQYIATNVSNSATKTAMTVNTTQPGPSITISLGKDANGNVQLTTSFDTSKVTADNTGSEIFEWSGVTNLPAGWTYDDTNKTLTYKPTSDADKAALINALAKTGTYAVNWSGAKDATAPALVDQFGDVMNLVIDTKVKSQNSITANVDTSDSTKVNADHQYTFSNADIVSATKANDPNGMVTAFIKNLAGTSGKTYEGTMNGLPLPNGVKSVTLNADGSVTVTFDPDKATANYDKATNTNVIKLVLPFTVDSNGQYIPDTGDTTNKTPLDNLTLNMNMQADLKLAYQAAAGGADTTVKDGNSTDNVAYVQAGQDLQSPVTRNGLALGSTYSATVPATINAASTANYQGASYKLINGVATNDPNAVNFNDTQLTFGGNTSTYLYAKTYGSVWNVTSTAPSLTDVPSAPVSDGITTTIDLSNAAKDFNWQTVSFQPDANTAANYTTTVTVNKDAKSLTVTYKPRNAAADLDFLADTYQDGFDLNGWLTDTQTPDGSKTPVMHNALYVKTKTAPLKLADFTKKATINVAKSGDGYDASAKTYTFDVPSTALSVKQLALLANGQKLVLTSGSSQADLEKGNSSVNADNWKNITGVTMSLGADGTSAHIVATLNTAFAKSNVQKGAVLTLGADGDSPLASGIHLELTLVNDLKQQASGLPADLPKESQPVYPTEADQALNSRFVAKSQAVTGYAVVSAADQNNKTLQITKNADGSASYAVNYDWGVETGDPVADQITWNYAQAEIDGSIGSQTKVYGKDDPSTPYTVTLPSWLTAPKWTKDDFERDNDTSEDVGDHNVKLSAKGISDLAAANKSFTIDATTLAKLTDGTLTITPTVTVEYVDQDGNELAGKKAVDITDEKKGATITIA